MPSQVFQFGSAGLATSAGGDGLQLEARDWRQRGSEAEVTLIIRQQSSLADAKALLAQVVGYDLNTDQPVIPITWTQDATVDGLYRVQRVEAGPEITGRLGSPTEAGGNVAWTVTAELLRVPSSRAPNFEILSLGADRSTAHAITEWSWIGSPNANDTQAEWLASRASVPLVNGLAGPNGDTCSNIAAPTASKTLFYEDAYNYLVDPGSFYVGAARVEASTDSGTTWRLITDREVPFSTLSSTNRLRISNGAVRLELPDGSSALSLSVWNNGVTAWQSKTFKITEGGSSASAIGVAGVPTILRNDPVAATVRFSNGVVDSGSAGGMFDLTVRRGSWVIEGHATLTTSANAQLGVFRTSNEAGTSVTGGITATSDDADGNKYELRSPSAITAETTKGGIYLTSAAQTFPFAIATDFFALNGTTTGPTTSQLYFAAMTHQQRIVAR